MTVVLFGGIKVTVDIRQRPPASLPATGLSISRNSQTLQLRDSRLDSENLGNY